MITVRKRKFDFSNSPKYYYNDSKLITHFFNALSATFPPGEEFFVRAVRHYRKNTNTPLEKDIAGFCGQESWHSLAHETMNDYAKFHNVDLKKYEKKIDKLLKRAEKILTPKMCLAATVALEHYTATMGKEILENPKWLNNFEEPYKELIKWHSTEEVEHRHVAYDVYMREGSDYLTRVSVYVGASIIFWIIISLMTAELMLNDKDMDWFTRLDETVYGLLQLLGPKGFIINILKDTPMFFRPGFHPNQI